MADSFVLRFLAPDRSEWVAVDAGGARLGNVGRGSLAEAAAAAQGRRVIVLVPGSEVVLAAPELPARSPARLLQLAPVALEENLAAGHRRAAVRGRDRKGPGLTSRPLGWALAG